MATVTLTLNLDDDLRQRAEQLAAARNMSIGVYVERLLRVVTQPPHRVEDLPPVTRKLYGILPPATDAESRKTIEEELTRKHGPQE